MNNIFPRFLMLCILSLALTFFSNRAYGDFLGAKGFALRQGAPRIDTFQVTGVAQTFTLYFTADYACQLVVATESQMASFQSGGGISSVYDSFDGNFGVHNFTLPPGRYFLGVRSTSATEIICSYELEYFPVEPGADFIQTVKMDAQTLSPGTRFIQPFTVSSGSYYVIDGNNTGLEYYLIKASEFDHFSNNHNQVFSYKPDFSGPDNSEDTNQPGLFTLKGLPPGDYGLAFRNTSNKSAALTYGLYQYATGGSRGFVDLVDQGNSYRSLSQASAAPGENIRVRSRVSNQGSNSAGAFTVSYYASIDTTISGSDTLLGTQRLDGLAAGYYVGLDTTVPLPMSLPPGKYYIGWIIDSGDAVTESEEGNNIAYVATPFTVTAAPPLSWVSGEIGTGQLTGSAFYNAGNFTQAGSGVFGATQDKCHFTYQILTGDGQITAKVSSLQSTGNSSRVGVMIRDTLATNSKQIFIGLTGTGSYRWARRTTTGGNNSTTSSGSGSVPNTWLGLVRSGDKISAYKSTDGTAWTLIGSKTVTMAKNCYIGLAVASGSNTTLNTSKFSNVKVTP